jgi:hypothetical protein
MNLFVFFFSLSLGDSETTPKGHEVASTTPNRSPLMAKDFFFFFANLGLRSGRTTPNGHGVAKATLKLTAVVRPPFCFLEIFFNFLFF